MKPIPESSITLLCGEASGDLYGGMLAGSILKLSPNTHLQGIGGEFMRKAGVHILQPVSELSIMGFSEVLLHIPKLFALRNRIVDQIFASGSSAVILIDFPDFNLRVAEKVFQQKKLSGLEFPKIYYFVPPQVWIWRKNRIRRISQFCEAVFPLFSFEHDLYTKHGIKSFYFGHPATDTVTQNQYYEKRIENQGCNMSVGLFPGSRLQEVKKILPVMLNAVSEFKSSNKKTVSVTVSRCEWIPESVYSALIHQSNLPANGSVKLKSDSHEIMAYSDLILSKSGTVNLEIALFKKPFVVVYKTSRLTWFIAKLLVRIRRISLINILSNREIVKEFIQHKAKPALIAEEMLRIASDKAYTDAMIRQLTEFTGQHLPQGSGPVTDLIAHQILNGIKKSDDP